LFMQVGEEGVCPRYSLRYYMCDQELSVHMATARNSGVMSAELLRRQRVLNPDTGTPYTHHDLRIGAVLKVSREGGEGQQGKAVAKLCLPVLALGVVLPFWLEQLPQVHIEITAMDDEARRAMEQDDDASCPSPPPLSKTLPTIMSPDLPVPSSWSSNVAASQPTAGGAKEDMGREAEGCGSGSGSAVLAVGWLWHSPRSPTDDELDEYIRNIVAVQLR
jgi:hypothetical protein